MYIKLPREVLERIFTCPDVTKKDLLELQLTCKLWSPMAQKYIYKELYLQDRDLYTSNTRFDPFKVNERIRLLTQTVLLLDVQIKNQVRKIDLGSLYQYLRTISDSEKLTLSIATLTHICPNVTTLTGKNLPQHFYSAMVNLRRGGSLQKLECIRDPELLYLAYTPSDLLGRDKAIDVFKDTLKEFAIFNGASRTVTASNSIHPDNLHHFPRVEHLHLVESQRIHLFRLKDYISNCCPNTRSICIQMGYTETGLPEYEDQSSIVPQTQIRQLSLELPAQPLSTTEMSFIVRMFPSLEYICIKSMLLEDSSSVLSQHDLEVVVRFLDYLFLIPRVEHKYLWFGVSEGLGILSYLAKSIDVHHFTVAILEDHPPKEFFMQLDREIQSEEANSTAKTKHCSLTVQALSENTQAFFLGALGPFKDKPTINKLTFGRDISDGYEVQQVDEESLDYIINNYVSLQELEYRFIKFPSTATQSSTSKAKNLRRLDLHCCIFSENYFTKLSSQIVHVDHFIYSTFFGHQRRHMGTKFAKKLRILMPYTKIHTIELDISGSTSYSIRILTKFNCYALKATHSNSHFEPATLEACDGTDPVHKNTRAVIIHCLSLKKVCIGSTSFELPTPASEQ